jgi:transcriptional regulator GlxA family with amidase domain
MDLDQTTVGILIFDDIGVLDFSGPFEVFARASAPGAAPPDERRLFRVLTIAERDRPIRCRGGLLVHPDHTIADHPKLDVLVVPGGFGTRRERTNRVLLDWIAAQDRQTAVTTGVCTGAFLLAATGLLDGQRATTHRASIDWLREHHPAIDVRADERVVDAGHVVTSAGVAAGIDLALHVVGRLYGLDVAAEAARGMEYDWRTEPGAAGRSEHDPCSPQDWGASVAESGRLTASRKVAHPPRSLDLPGTGRSRFQPGFPLGD